MKRTVRFIVVCLALVALAAVSAGPTGAAPGSHDSQVNKDLAAARRATAKYHNVANAEAAGYINTHECVALPNGAAMGIHFVKPPLFGDGTVSVEEPEILLYVPSGNRLKLVGLEYWSPDADQDLTTDSDRPFLFGRGFDGPMEGHDPQMPRHYDVHVWVWHGNPDGMFAQFNPSLSCG